ncbi:hypothetical protein BTJ40_06940 [Microbulbifer sp. A4B17]|uniref:hypothetical protein n=1 Tax=Microbulbifer sp. A4B17 TaxID=359370 RepID=UPI000D52B924|nr:hypothetical protein [Microbulbifer sp. A4B17]AWF80564.1 hypothetical protein BTJ40_06940 [Microbulbifer sp. A4B17]
MATLQEIVEAILTDLNCAQDYSNKLISTLAEKNQDDYLLQNLSVPNVALKELEVDLRVVFQGDSIKTKEAPQKENLKNNVNLKRIREFTNKIVGLVIDDVAKRIRSAAEVNPSTELHKMGLRVADAIVKPYVVQSLVNYLLPLMKDVANSSSDPKVSIEVLLEKVRDKLGKVLSEDKLIEKSSVNIGDYLTNALVVHKQTIEDWYEEMQKLEDNVKAASLGRLLSSDVIIDSKSLSEFTEQMAQKIKLCVNLKCIIV